MAVKASHTTIPCGTHSIMIQTQTLAPDLRLLHGTNVRRLMTRLDMTLQDVVEATDLDERTVRSLLQGTTRPHTRTLHKLAQGLGVPTDELFQDPYHAGQALFDRATNGAVSELLDSHPELFSDWAPSDFDELFSRVGIGGELTESGALAAVHAMNGHRETLHRVAVVLESDEADLLRGFVEMLYERVRVQG